jgi:hypothetical protein
MTPDNLFAKEEFFVFLKTEITKNNEIISNSETIEFGGFCPDTYLNKILKEIPFCFAKIESYLIPKNNRFNIIKLFSVEVNGSFLPVNACEFDVSNKK